MKQMNMLCLIMLAMSLLASGCVSTQKRHAPQQNLSMMPPPGNETTEILVDMPFGGNGEFYKGTLEGLVLGPYEVHKARLFWGRQEHCVTIESARGDLISACDKILVTHRSKRLRIIPPYYDTRFGHRGKVQLELLNY